MTEIETVILPVLPVKISSYVWLKDKLTDPAYREYYYNMLKERNENAKEETKDLKRARMREYMNTYNKSDEQKAYYRDYMVKYRKLVKQRKEEANDAKERGGNKDE
jgi:hypothetical protein